MNTIHRHCTAMAVLCMAAAAASVASAQEIDTDMYDGRWSVRVQGLEAGYQSARLAIGNYGGTWRDTSGKGARIHKACRGKSFPVTVQRSTPSTFEFFVFGSAVSPACADFSVLIKPTEEKVLDGTIEPAGTIRLVRQR